MNTITILVFFITCALLLTLTFASPLDRDTNLDLNGQDKDQESKLLAQFRDAMKRERILTAEGQQPYTALEENVDKDSEDKSLIQDPMMSKRKQASCVWWFCG